MRDVSLKTTISLEIHRAYRSVQKQLHELNYLFWECTLRCNLNCIHCGSDCTKDTTTPDMPFADFANVLDQVATQYDPHKTIVAITGGEPLVRQDLDACGKQIFAKGYPWGMVTNGYLLTEKRLQSLCDSGLRSITISLDGLQDSHNWMRGKSDSFKKALNAIKFCSQQKDLIFDVVTCVNKRNLGELDEIRKLLTDNNVKKWRLFTIFPKGRAKETEDLLLADSEFTTLMHFITATRDKQEIDATYGCEGFLGKFEGKARDGFFFCRAGITVGSVLADGSISACPSLRGDFIQGNIYKDNFLDCWNNRYESMRNRSWAKTGDCATCKQFKYCEGNGLHLREGPGHELLVCHYEKIK